MCTPLRPIRNRPTGYRRRSNLPVLWGVLAATFPAACAAVAAGAGHVVTDGTLGRGVALQPLNGTYSVTADLGKQVGPNLFQSFSQFQLVSGETAAFSGPPSVHNVLARVTGGAASNIDGTLRCNIANANFYLVNPSGVIFGPDAKLDVSGSFAVTTANLVKLADGGKFTATMAPGDTVLSSAPPAAFGFLGNSPAALTSNGATLAVPTGKSILAAAGPVQVSGGSLIAPGGLIGVVSTASAGSISFDPVTLAPGDVTAAALGPVTMSFDAALSTAGPAGGPISVQCGTLLLTGGARIDSSTIGLANGGDIAVSASGPAVVGGLDPAGNMSGIFSNTYAPGTGGAAGSISLRAASLQVLDNAEVSSTTFGQGVGGNVTVSVPGAVLLSGFSPTGIFALSASAGAGGNAGSVTLSAGSLAATGGAAIASSTFGSGAGGAIDVTVSGQAMFSGADAANKVSGIFAGSNATGTSGNAGSVSLTAGSLQLLNGAQVSSATNGSGSSGDVSVNVAGLAVLSGSDAANIPAIIVANSTGRGNSGNAGSVSVNAGTLQLLGGTEISSSTVGSGAGGNINVSVAGQTLLSGTGPTNSPSGIFAVCFGPGKAGSVKLATQSLQASGGAQISSSTFSSGAGGDVSVNVSGEALFTGVNPALAIPSGIFAASEVSGSGGNAGSVTLTAGSLQLLDGAEVSSATFGLGSGGNVAVHVAGQALLFGLDTPAVPSGIFVDSNVAGPGGNAGSISVSAAGLQVLAGARISSSTFGQGTGGDVKVNVSGAALIAGPDQPGILAETFGTTLGGNGGTIQVTARSLDIFRTGLISAQTHGAGNGGSVVIDAGAALLSGPQATIDSRSTGGGVAGSVNVAAASQLIVNRSSLEVDAGTARGGDLTITGADLTFYGGVLRASSGGGFIGGNVSLTASGQTLLLGTRVSADGGGNGGNIAIDAGGAGRLTGAERAVDSLIAIHRAGANVDPSLSDPLLVTLDRARLNANGGVNGGNILVHPSLLLQSGSLLTATGVTGVAGSVALSPPDIELAGSLVILPGSLIPRGAGLAPVCGQRLGLPSLSSFIITGAGGPPLEPGGFLSSDELFLPNRRDQQSR